MNNVVVITARMDSERLPGKALIHTGGIPNLCAIYRRFKRCHEVSSIVVATSTDASDDPIAQWCLTGDVPLYRGSKEDVLGRVLAAAPETDYILRATCDCPFISWNLVDLAFQVVRREQADTARVWGMPDRMVPLYGAAEFPVSRECLERMSQHVASPSAREHVTADLDENRLAYQVVYPVAPRVYSETFYRPYRLELDTPADLDLVNAVLFALGDTPPLEQVVGYLDQHPEIARLNAGIAEKTGPLTSYNFETRARWKMQQARASVEWRGDWSWVKLPYLPDGAQRLYCCRGSCYVGYVTRGPDGTQRLHRPDGTILQGQAQVPCECGAGREWVEG